MAVALDATGGGGTGAGAGTAASISWSHVVGAGSNRLLLVTIGRDKTAASLTVTYGGVSLTRLGVYQSSVGSNDRQIEFWQLVNPTSGTANIVATPPSADTFAGCSQSFTGVDQTTPLGTAVTASGTSTTPTATVTSAANNMVVGAVSSVVSSAPTATGTSQTRDGAQAWGFSTTKYVAASHQPGASSVTESWSTASAVYVTAGVTVYAVGAAPAAARPAAIITRSRAVSRASVI